MGSSLCGWRCVRLSLRREEEEDELFPVGNDAGDSTMGRDGGEQSEGARGKGGFRERHFD